VLFCFYSILCLFQIFWNQLFGGGRRVDWFQKIRVPIYLAPSRDPVDRHMGESLGGTVHDDESEVKPPASD